MNKMHKILNIGTACTGCFACSNACPKNAITLPENNEGFYYPVIDAVKCIDCGLCDKVCPRVEEKEYHTMQKAFYGWTKDQNVRKNSSSGGIFNLLATEILKDNGVVYGASFNYEGEIRLECHSTDEVSLMELQRSKYVQSHIGDAFCKIKKDLNLGRKVLFCGTPCQVDGLNSFLRKEYENLVTVDFVCHGVPSMSLLNKHLQYIGLEKIKEINFRPKNRTWVDDLKITHGKGVRNTPWVLDEYFYTFQKYKSIRPSCFECLHCNGKRSADITLADFWGIHKYKPEEFDAKGISLVLTNTVKGDEFIDVCREKGECCLRTLPQDSAMYVYSKIRSASDSGYDIEQRNSFIGDVYAMGYEKALVKHKLKVSKVKLLKYRIKQMIKNLLKKN